jgi:YegS/Rv2252/BmrU family lipid kinase
MIQTVPDRINIFANPIAGRGRGKTAARRLEQDLSAAGFSVQTFFDRPTDLSLDSIGDDVHTAISIGGDGTLRGVVNLFYSTHTDGPPILPIPMGTANLMGRHLGIRWPDRGLSRAITDTIHRRHVIRLDAGRANGQLFLLMAGVGIDGQIVHLVDRMRRGPIDKAAYLLPAAMTFASWSFPPITVDVDGKRLLQQTPAIVMIANVKEYGIGIPILPDAVANDGLLDVCLMPCRNRLELIELLVQIAAGEHVQRESVISTRGQSIHITADHPVAVQVDGDSAGFTPLVVDLLPSRVPFLLPG